jgi:hypothetical protein
VEVLGGIDPTTLDGDAEGQLALLFGLAERYGVQLDIHLHEPGETGLAQLLRIAARTRPPACRGGLRSAMPIRWATCRWRARCRWAKRWPRRVWRS